MRALVAFLLLAASGLAQAGAQKQEEITDEVRQRLAAWAGDKAAPRLVFRNPADGQRWLDAMSERLEKRIPDRKERMELLRTIHYEAIRMDLDPQLVLGIIEVESAFRKYAVSHAGAMGYMQVMPFWTREARRPRDNLFHRRTNLMYGCFILRLYIDREKGDYFRALGRYNGSLGQAEYPNLVLGAWKKRWRYDGPTR